MSRISPISGNGRTGRPAISLALEIQEPLLVAYLEPLSEPERSMRAIEALKVGVIALQTACPTLDSQIVKDQFAEMQNDFGEALERFFAEKDGVVPKSLNDAFGEKGSLSQFLLRYFDPERGRLALLMENRIGPSSEFAKLFDPKHKDSVIVVIEDRVKQLVESKLEEMLCELSLDEKNSAMSRLKEMFDSGLSGLREALGIKAAKAEEAERGHIKGFSFEEDLYEVIATLGRQFGDETEFVRGIPGINKCKTGDHLITLGESTGAPGLRIVVEVKDQEYKLKKATAELQEAKKNRDAVSGIFVFAKGCEPSEVGNFRRIDNDYYCTADKSVLADYGTLPFLWAAYELARVQAVAALRKASASGKVDFERIQAHIDGIAGLVTRLGEIITKATTVQNSGKAIGDTAKEIKLEIEQRTADIRDLLMRDAA